MRGALCAGAAMMVAALALSACSDLAARPQRILSAAETLPAATAHAPAQTATPAPTPTAAPTATPQDLWLAPFDVSVLPAGELYSGDIVSFRVQAHNPTPHSLSRVPLVVDWGGGQARDTIIYLPAGGAGSVDLEWVWDTGTISGTQPVTVTLDPDGEADDPDRSNSVAVVRVELADARPADDAGAAWRTTTTACCVFHYLNGMAAERDIEDIGPTADAAIDYVADRLGVTPRRLQVYLIDRVVGHGGFAGNEIVISYLDRNYAGGSLAEVFRHEGVHMLDQQITAGDRPPFLVEGFAVYVTGGHFKIEPLPQRAAALLERGGYIPLRALADDFYASQHETGYLEAGAFIDYLIARDGYDAFVELYADLKRQPGESDARLLDRELTAEYGLGLEELEAEWLAYLRTLDPGDQTRDIAASIAFYDTVRRYQQALDPFAHFRQAWLPDIAEAERRGITADYARHPRAAENIALETMLVAADGALMAGRFEPAEALLASVNAVLDADGAFLDATAAQYLAVTRAALAMGYEPQRIVLDGRRAELEVTRAGDPTLIHLAAGLDDGAWRVR